MLKLSDELKSALRGDEVEYAFLLKVDFPDGTVRWTNSDVPIQVSDPQPGQYEFGYWVEFVRSTSGTEIVEDPAGNWYWMRTSDGLPLEQQQLFGAEWKDETSDLDEPDVIKRDIHGGRFWRARKEGHPWIPSENGIDVAHLDWKGEAVLRVFTGMGNPLDFIPNGEFVSVSAPERKGSGGRDLYAIVFADPKGDYAKRFAVGTPIESSVIFRRRFAGGAKGDFLIEPVTVFKGFCSGKPSSVSDEGGRLTVVECVGPLAWLDQSRAIYLTDADQRRRNAVDDSLKYIHEDRTRKLGERI